MNERKKCTCAPNVDSHFSKQVCCSIPENDECFIDESSHKLSIEQLDKLICINDQLYCVFSALMNGDEHCEKIGHVLYKIWDEFDDILLEI